MCTEQRAYLGSAGGPEWLNEPVHPLQDRCRTQGGQPCKHDEGQHLPRRKETRVLGEMTQDKKKQVLRESRGVGPNTWSSNPNSH